MNATAARKLPNWAKLSLQYDRTQEPAQADAAARLANELDITRAALSKSRERAEDAERDLAEALAKIDTLTDERNQLATDLSEADDAGGPEAAKLAQELAAIRDQFAEALEERDEARAEQRDAETRLAAANAKIEAHANELAIEANRLSAAWRQIAELKAALDDAASRIRVANARADRASERAESAERKPAESPQPVAAAESPPEPRKPSRSARQVWNAKTGQWQAA